MLYNQNWEKPKDPMSLDGLIQWLETKDPDEKYCYIVSEGCLLAQYFRAKGWAKARVSPSHLYSAPVRWLPFIRLSRPLPSGFNDIAVQGLFTFGAALDRACAYREAHQHAL